MEKVNTEKKTRGGARPNAGRKPGGKNKTVAARKNRTYYANDTEFAKICENAGKTGKSLSDFVRDRALMD
ncbi:MAG: hypothetical protein FWH48_03020 [Oscillospiraceae bacterium]|nr:hypothetical protein [Oscillospiraceae bacterium]